MATERFSGVPLWTAAVAALLVYGIIGALIFRSWRCRHEAKAIIALAEKYKQTHGHLPDCESDASFAECEKSGLEQPHAIYEKKSETRYLVEYFGFLGMTVYDSSTGIWKTAYWWNGHFKEALQ